jgi:hypothetical protein
MHPIEAHPRTDQVLTRKADVIGIPAAITKWI